MARSSRRDDAPDVADVVAEDEAAPALPTATNDDTADQELEPARADAEEPVALDPGDPAPDPDTTDSAPHELLAVEEPPASIDKPTKDAKPAKGKESEPAQLISGDPLLGRAVAAGAESERLPDNKPDLTPETKPHKDDERAASPVVSGPPPPPPSSQRQATPPPPPPRQAVRPNPVPPQRSAGIGVGAIGGVVAPGGSQTARRAARGAQVTGTQAALPPRRPEQPVATLRPTTVAPVPRLAGRRPRVRRVTRVVRHVDPWSVFKVSAAFSVVAYAIALVAGVLLWNVAYATGTIDNIERGMESTGWETFELDGGQIFHNAWVGGIFVAVGMTGLAVLVATLFNLITDLVGGVRFTVLEEEVVEKTASPMRRFAMSAGNRAPTGGRPVPNAEERVRRARGD